eukprot:scaffold675_cov72-Skeletonema_dohrnii-CCMP3373.AAC.1
MSHYSYLLPCYRKMEVVTYSRRSMDPAGDRHFVLDQYLQYDSTCPNPRSKMLYTIKLSHHQL